MLFIVVLFSLLITMAPTVYTLDSAEFALGAKTLGFVHAPGYPLYLVLAHIFTYLPLGDIAYRVNLFSAVCLALTAPVLYDLLYILIQKRWVAVTSTLIFIWSHYAWINGLVAEIYGPQLFTLCVTGWLLAQLYQRHLRGAPYEKLPLFTGLWYGFTVAMVPSSILFAGGLVVSYLLLRTPWKTALLAALLSVVTFCIPLSYFPLRAQADPVLNMAGNYDPVGNFQPIDLETPAGIWSVIRCEQFEELFFAEGYFPSMDRLLDFLHWFTGNFLGVGVIIGLVGGYILYVKKRRLFFVWLIFLLPYTYFFLVYGAADVEMMFSPTYLVWTIALAYGLDWSTEDQSRAVKYAVAAVAIGLFLFVNFPLVDVSSDTQIYDEAEAVLNYLPPDSLLFGQWLDVVPLQYIQQVDKLRQDVTLYNIGLFKPAFFFPYFETLQRPLFMLDKPSVDVYASENRYQVFEHHIMSTIIYEIRPVGE